MGHVPVMLPEVLDVLSPQGAGVYVDGTFGRGGYTRGILESSSSCRVVAIDRDPSAQAAADAMKATFGERMEFIRGNFGAAKTLLQSAGFEKIDGFVLDIGVSSVQLDTAERGFSFQADGPLDMRMDNNSKGETAADIVNTYEEEALADILYQYGEERKSRRIAKVIVEKRTEKPIETTLELAEIVASALPKNFKDKIHPATRSFQALRIAVNDELGELERALEASIDLLAPNGRMVVVSFHSLEDRIVKSFFRKYGGENPRGSRHMPDIGGADNDPVYFKLEDRKAVKPTKEEAEVNPRARSARLRWAIRTDVPSKSDISAKGGA